MNPIYTPLLVAGVAIVMQIATGYGIYRAFVSRAETKFAEIDRRLAESDRDRAEQWRSIGKNREEIGFLRGLFAAAKGKGATS